MGGKKANSNGPSGYKHDVTIKVLEIFIPAFLSIVAIAISISVANNQNKISLFEKRYEVFQTCKALNINAQMAEATFSTQEIDVNSIEVWIAYVAHIIPQSSIMNMDVFKTEGSVTEQEALEVYLQISQEISNCCVQLESSKYIFDLSETEKAEIDDIIEALGTITYEGLASDPYDLGAKMKELTRLLVNISAIEAMEEQLSIS